MFDGSYTIFEGLRRPDIVTTVGLVEGKIVTVTDVQPHRGVRIGLPGGRVDPEDESLLAAAQREMREETGYEFASWRLVEVVHPQAKLEYFQYYYLATNLTAQHAAVLDAGGEEIVVELCDYDACLRKFSEGYGSIIDHRFLQKAGSLEELLKMPEFIGTEVDIPVKD